jgi:hypothetical protein
MFFYLQNSDNSLKELHFTLYTALSSGYAAENELAKGEFDEI